MAKVISSELYGVDPRIWRKAGPPSAPKGASRLRYALRAASLNTEALSQLEDFPAPEHLVDALRMGIECWGDTRRALQRIVPTMLTYARRTEATQTLLELWSLDLDLWCWIVGQVILVQEASSRYSDAYQALRSEVLSGRWPKSETQMKRLHDKLLDEMAQIGLEYENAGEMDDRIRSDAERERLEAWGAASSIAAILSDEMDSVAGATETMVQAYAEQVAVRELYPHRSRYWDTYDETVDEVRLDLRGAIADQIERYPYDRLVNSL